MALAVNEICYKKMLKINHTDRECKPNSLINETFSIRNKIVGSEIVLYFTSIEVTALLI